MLLTNNDFFYLHNFLGNDWTFFNPDVDKIFAINTFDDGNEKYSKYNNEWYVIGNFNEKVCLLNTKEKIIIHSISQWKITKIDFIYTTEMMIQTKNLFSTLPDELKNDDFKLIENDVLNYIKKHCKHNIVDDYIDIGPEKSQPIKYCDICYTEF